MAGAIASRADAAGLTPLEQANVRNATDFCAAWKARDVEWTDYIVKDN